MKKIYIGLTLLVILACAGLAVSGTEVEMRGRQVWGQIKGLLTDQADLKAALDAKVPYSGATQDVNLGNRGFSASSISVTGTPLSVSSGGTGTASVTANGPIVGGTTSTGALVSVAPGTAGQVLTSAGPTAPPNYQDPPAGTVPNGSTAGDILFWTGSAWSTGSGYPSWGMADEFWQDRPAGAVHNTLSDAKYPFLSRLRAVTDTENKLSISGGRLTFAGGKATPAWGDPGVWYGSLSRAAGRILTGKVSPSSTGQDFAIGWHHSQSGTFANTSSRIYFTTSGRIYPLESITVGTYSVGDYQYAVVLRASGSLVFVKGGAVYPNWTLVWVTAQGNTSPLYPALLDYNGTFSADYLRIPSQLWLPSPLISDGFSGTDGALLSSRLTDGQGHAEGVAGGIGAGGVGSSWTGAYGNLKAVEQFINSGFDSTITGWTATASGTIASVSGGQAGNCLELTRVSSTNQAAYQGIPTVIGSTYTVTGYVKSGTSGDESFKIYTGTATAVNPQVVGVSSNAWTPFSFTFPGTGSLEAVYLMKNTGTAGTMLFDSVSVTTPKAIITPSLGAEQIINGGFDAGIDGWTIAAGNEYETFEWDASGKLHAVNTTGTGYCSSPLFTSSIGWYHISFNYTKANGVYPSFAITKSSTGQRMVSPDTFHTVGNGGISSTSPVVTFRLTEVTNQARFFIYSGTNNAADYTLDDVTVKPLTLSSLFSSVTASTPNVVAAADLTRAAGTQAGLVLNLDSASNPQNFIIAYLDGAGNAKLEKCVAGTYTSLISAAVTYVADAKLVVIKDGSSYDLYYNNAKVGTTATVADAGIVSNVLHGLFSTYERNTFDNFVVRARGTEGQYAVLDEIGGAN